MSDSNFNVLRIDSKPAAPRRVKASVTEPLLDFWKLSKLETIQKSLNSQSLYVGLMVNRVYERFEGDFGKNP